MSDRRKNVVTALVLIVVAEIVALGLTLLMEMVR